LKIAAIQMVSTPSVDTNVAAARRLVGSAAAAVGFGAGAASDFVASALAAPDGEEEDGVVQPMNIVSPTARIVS